MRTVAFRCDTSFVASLKAAAKKNKARSIGDYCRKVLAVEMSTRRKRVKPPVFRQRTTVV